jgi:predicted metal-dependent peptidase
MSDDDLEYCMNEVFNIVKVYEGYKITIIECDAEIGKIYEAKNMADLQLKMSGRGGTSFIPVIEYINGEGHYANNSKYPHAGQYRDALLIYFTDGYGDYEIPKPKTYRNLWVVT